jgi:hypothetical protein
LVACIRSDQITTEAAVNGPMAAGDNFARGIGG